MDTPTGPVMIAATTMMRPPRTRIGKIGNIALPRSVPLVATGLAIVGFVLFFAAATTFLDPLTALFYAGPLGAAVGAATATMSPLRGESLATWLGLNAAQATRTRVDVNGRHERAFIGVAPLHRTAAGRTRLMPGAVEVPAGSVDERGVLIRPKDRRLPGQPALGNALPD